MIQSYLDALPKGRHAQRVLSSWQIKPQPAKATLAFYALSSQFQPQRATLTGTTPQSLLKRLNRVAHVVAKGGLNPVLLGAGPVYAIGFNDMSLLVFHQEATTQTLSPWPVRLISNTPTIDQHTYTLSILKHKQTPTLRIARGPCADAFVSSDTAALVRHPVALALQANLQGLLPFFQNPLLVEPKDGRPLHPENVWPDFLPWQLLDNATIDARLTTLYTGYAQWVALSASVDTLLLRTPNYPTYSEDVILSLSNTGRLAQSLSLRAIVDALPQGPGKTTGISILEAFQGHRYALRRSDKLVKERSSLHHLVAPLTPANSAHERFALVARFGEPPSLPQKK